MDDITTGLLEELKKLLDKVDGENLTITDINIHHHPSGFNFSGSFSGTVITKEVKDIIKSK